MKPRLEVIDAFFHHVEGLEYDFEAANEIRMQTAKIYSPPAPLKSA